MSVIATSSRYPANNRPASPRRPVVVPDRMVKQNAETSPMINLQSSGSVAPAVVHVKKPSATRRRKPVNSSAIHPVKQAAATKGNQRPRVPERETTAAAAMERLIKRHNSLPLHLGRTAGRAHLLSHALELESKRRRRWHQKILFGFAS